MRRVVVTGMGIVSSIGNNIAEVLQSLRTATPGIVFAQDYADYNFRCQVHGAPKLDPFEVLDRRTTRFMGKGAAWNYIAMQQAIADSGPRGKDIQNPRTGIVMGSGGPSTRTVVEAADITREKGPKRIGPLAVPKAMSSTASATLATPFGIKGVNYIDHLGLRDVQALHRQWLRADPDGQAGHRLRRRPRGSRLDAVHAVRRHGRHVDRLQRDARQGLTRL